MFAALLLLPAFAALVAAAPQSVGNAQCNTGAVQCCQSVQPASSSAVAPLLQDLGILIQDLNIPIGLTCSPISVIAVAGGTNCASEPVCCDDNSFNGLVAIGCTPINIGL